MKITTTNETYIRNGNTDLKDLIKFKERTLKTVYFTTFIRRNNYLITSINYFKALLFIINKVDFNNPPDLFIHTLFSCQEHVTLTFEKTKPIQ